MNPVLGALPIGLPAGGQLQAAERITDEHKEILDAIKSRSADAARIAMRAHLTAATAAAAGYFGDER